MTFHDIARKTSLLTAIQMAITVGLAYLIAVKMALWLHFGNAMVSGLWAGISAIVVMQVQIEEVHHAGRLRMLGSLLGGVCSAVISFLLGYTVLSMVSTMFITTILLSLLNMKAALRLANLTALIIIIVGMIDPSVSPWENAFARVLQSAVGVSISIMLVWLFHPIRKKFDLFQSY